MIFPDTPATVISHLIGKDRTSIWQGAWQNFFDLYHCPIKLMVSKSFKVNGWSDVPSHIIDDVVSDVCYNLIKIFSENKYDTNRTKFRFFLKAIAHRRTIDYIRSNTKAPPIDSLNDDDRKIDELLNEAYQISFLRQLEDDEELAFKQAFILDLYNSIRNDFDPKTTAAFEMVKFENRDIDYVVKELGITKNTVNNDVYRIMKKLKELVSKEENQKELKK